MLAASGAATAFLKLEFYRQSANAQVSRADRHAQFAGGTNCSGARARIPARHWVLLTCCRNDNCRHSKVTDNLVAAADCAATM
jgi:hypothetical protein